jgi:hypothetical protein
MSYRQLSLVSTSGFAARQATLFENLGQWLEDDSFAGPHSIKAAQSRTGLRGVHDRLEF